MTDCPIGLICDCFECDRRYCQRLAAPWPLPYRIASSWQPWLLIEIPRLDNFNWRDQRIIHTEIQTAGFFDPIKLPYQAHAEGGLLVTGFLALTETITFVCPYEAYFDEKLNCWMNNSPCYWKGDEFMPALPLPEDEYDYTRGSTCFWEPILPDPQPGEFWEDHYLYYPVNPGHRGIDDSDPTDYQGEGETEYN